MLEPRFITDRSWVKVRCIRLNLKISSFLLTPTVIEPFRDHRECPKESIVSTFVSAVCQQCLSPFNRLLCLADVMEIDTHLNNLNGCHTHQSD